MWYIINVLYPARACAKRRGSQAMPETTDSRPVFGTLQDLTAEQLRQTIEVLMTNPTPAIQLMTTPDYRENYANSVQVRVNVWDFFLVFGTLQQQDETRVEVRNFQGIYLSPQQAKALHTILQQNLVNYENTFGEIKLDPRIGPGAGPVH
jgi:flagellar protein FlaG